MAASDDDLTVTRTPIPGLLLVELPVHGDARGWFKENWQRDKMVAAGVPDFGPVQNNIAYNDAVGTTRGIHAEPWDKWVSVATGRFFGAWVDLRDGPSFGTVFTAEVDASRAVFVPRGVGNAYQTLEQGTVYTYLVNDHWSPDTEYRGLDLADASAAIPWPIPLDSAVVSAKDRALPGLAGVAPISPRRILVVGADGQLGRALRTELGSASHIEYAGRADLDLTDPDIGRARRWREIGTIINAAAYTAVDRAETAEGRVDAWRTNVSAVAALARIAEEHRITLVHVSSDYVFDGTSAEYDEDDPPAPLSVYGQTKAAADAVVSALPRHYIVRTSWLTGDGPNFVRTMASLAEKGARPRVVGDQVGRPTFAADLAAAIRHLVASDAPFGVYNVTSSGAPASWAEIARMVFAETGHDPERVTEVSTDEYAATASGPVAPRPRCSVLRLRRIEAAGFRPPDMRAALRAYLG